MGREAADGGRSGPGDGLGGVGASRRRGAGRAGAHPAGERAAGRGTGGRGGRAAEPEARSGHRAVRRRARQSRCRWAGQGGQALRRADLPEGPRLRTEGPHAGFRFGVHQGHAHRRHRSGRGELPARRPGAARPLHHARVRHDLRHHHRLSRRGQGDAQPVEPGAHAGRLVRRFGSRGGGGHRAAVHVVGRWRIDAHPGVVLRPGRTEGLARPRAAAAGAQRVRHAHQHRWRGLAQRARHRGGVRLPQPRAQRRLVHQDGRAGRFLSRRDRARAGQAEDRPLDRALGPRHRYRPRSGGARARGRAAAGIARPCGRGTERRCDLRLGHHVADLHRRSGSAAARCSP